MPINSLEFRSVEVPSYSVHNVLYGPCNMIFIQDSLNYPGWIIPYLTDMLPKSAVYISDLRWKIEILSFLGNTFNRKWKSGPAQNIFDTINQSRRFIVISHFCYLRGNSPDIIKSQKKSLNFKDFQGLFKFNDST